MNAYDLSEKLTDCLSSKERWNVRSRASIMLREQATLINYYKVRNDSHVKIVKAQENRIAELEKEVKELHKIAQVMAMQESDARKSLQNYKDKIK